MSSRSRTVQARHATRAARSRRSRSGLPSLSEKQARAYLAARDALRRILRTNALLMPADVAGDGGDRIHTDDGGGRRCR
jgi:hypothetical protein